MNVMFIPGLIQSPENMDTGMTFGVSITRFHCFTINSYLPLTLYK